MRVSPSGPEGGKAGRFGQGSMVVALAEVRRWTSWHRWTILALLACAFLAILAASQPVPGHAPVDLLMPLTRNEARRLLTGLCQLPPAPRLQLF